MSPKIIEEIFASGGLLSKSIPDYEPRAGQHRMAERVFNTLIEGGKLVVEAGTGTGKTFAYLIPAIVSGKKVIVSTGTKNLEEQIFGKDIPILKKKLGMKFNAAVMKGRRNYLCRKRWMKFHETPLFDFEWEGRYLSKIAKWVETTNTGDRAEIKGLPESYPTWRSISTGSEGCAGSKCSEFERCYVTKMKRDALAADLVVVNHALYFSDLGLKSKSEYGGVLPDNEAVIFDEAHLIEDAATSHFGFEVGSMKLDDLVKDIVRAMVRGKSSSADVEKSAMLAQTDGRGFFESFGGLTNGERLPKQASDKVVATGSRFIESLKHLASALRSLKGEEEWDKAADRVTDLAHDAKFIIEQPNREYVYWRERRERSTALRASPIDLKPIFQGILYPSVEAVIFTSATLSVADSLKTFQTAMGLNGDSVADMVGTPFDMKRQAALFVPKKFPDPNSPDHIDAVADSMKKLVEMTKGRAFLLFTSYRAMEEVHRRIAPKMSYQTLKQGDCQKSEIVERFKSEPSVLFATQSFWQGVDVMGDALSLVVIDKLPFAVPTEPVVEARIEWIKENGGNAFNEFQLPRAVLMLKQGLGRLIRHRNDRGVLAVLDPRIFTKGYGSTIRKSLADFALTDSFAAVGEFASSM